MSKISVQAYPELKASGKKGEVTNNDVVFWTTALQVCFRERAAVDEDVYGCVLLVLKMTMSLFRRKPHCDIDMFLGRKGFLASVGAEMAADLERVLHEKVAGGPDAVYMKAQVVLYDAIFRGLSHSPEAYKKVVTSLNAQHSECGSALLVRVLEKNGVLNEHLSVDDVVTEFVNLQIDPDDVAGSLDTLAELVNQVEAAAPVTLGQPWSFATHCPFILVALLIAKLPGRFAFLLPMLDAEKRQGTLTFARFRSLLMSVGMQQSRESIGMSRRALCGTGRRPGVSRANRTNPGLWGRSLQVQEKGFLLCFSARWSVPFRLVVSVFSCCSPRKCCRGGGAKETGGVRPLLPPPPAPKVFTGELSAQMAIHDYYHRGRSAFLAVEVDVAQASGVFSVWRVAGTPSRHFFCCSLDGIAAVFFLTTDATVRYGSCQRRKRPVYWSRSGTVDR